MPLQVKRLGDDPQPHLDIDHCPSCSGLFFNPGELEHQAHETARTKKSLGTPNQPMKTADLEIGDPLEWLRVIDSIIKIDGFLVELFD